MKRIMYAMMLIAATLFVAVGTASAAKPKHKPLLTPQLSLSVKLNGNQVSITGGYKLKRTSLPTALRWSEQEFDASGNPLPLNPAVGYQYVPDKSNPGQFKALTTASGTSRTVNQRIPGANRLELTVTTSIRGTKTHKRASNVKTYSFNLGGNTAIGTGLPRLSNGGDQGSSCQWSGMWEGNTSSVTLLLPQTWTCFANIGNCKPVGLTPSAPHDLVPASNRGNGVTDGTIMGTPYTIYGFYLTCTNGYTVESQLWMRFGYPNGDACELPLAGVTSFTVPSMWGGNSAPWATLQTMIPSSPTSSEGFLYYGSPMLKESILPFIPRTSGNHDICAELHLPAQNTSSIIA